MVDERLSHFNGNRPERLTRRELPGLAQAIVACARKRASVERLMAREVPCIWLHGDGINVLVRGEDWSRLIPYLLDGTFDVAFYPVLETFVALPNTHYDPSVVGLRDEELYSRVLNVLSQLFTVEFPKR